MNRIQFTSLACALAADVCTGRLQQDRRRHDDGHTDDSTTPARHAGTTTSPMAPASAASR